MDASPENLWEEGLARLVGCEARPNVMDVAQIKAAAQCFSQSLKLNADQVQPYVGLAYVAHVLGDATLAQAYITLGESVDADFPPLQELKKRMG